MTNLLVKDDAATPKEWTLIPISDNPESFWRANDSAIPLDGQPRLTVSVVKQKNGGYKITAKLEVPTMETLGASGTSSGYVAPPRVAYVTPVIITMFADKRSTSADRMNALNMAVGLCQGASSVTASGTLTQATAGAGWSASAAPLVQLFNGLVVPN
jgi:hypothetical protein